MAAGFYAQTIYVGPAGNAINHYLYDTVGGGAGPFITATLIRDTAGNILDLTTGLPVSVASLPLPAGASTSTLQTANGVLLGAATETAPATDTASSGLNGRLQRIAQRLTTLITAVGTFVFGHGTAAAALRVELPTDGTGVVGLNAGTNAIGKLAANSGVTVGAVEIAAAQTLATVTTVGTVSAVTTVTTVTTVAAVTAISNALPAGTNTLGSVYRPSSSKSLTPTTSGASYIIGDVVGGIITIATVNASSGRGVCLRSLQLVDANANGAILDLYFFKATPSGGTYTDNAQLVWGAGDAANLVGVVQIRNTDWVSVGGWSLVNASNMLLDMPLTGTSLFLLIVARGSYTFTNGNLLGNAEFDQR